MVTGAIELQDLVNLLCSEWFSSVSDHYGRGTMPNHNFLAENFATSSAVPRI